MANKKNTKTAQDFWSWCNKTGQARVYEFKVSGNDIYSLLDFDTSCHSTAGMRSAMSGWIDEFQNIDPEVIDNFKNSPEASWTPDNYDNYLCYRFYKMIWLANDIEKRGQKAPVQLLQSGREYQTHPGSDKKFVIAYLQQLDEIHGFYIWYPILDPSPWIWSVPNRELKTADEFLDIFQHADDPTFVVEMNKITFTEHEYQCSNAHMLPFCEGAALGIRKYGLKNPELNMTLMHLSYRDAVHRKKMEIDEDIFNSIHFSDEDTFHLGQFVFIRKADGWWPVHLLNSPRSLVDGKWQNDDRKATYFNRVKSNIGNGRHYL